MPNINNAHTKQIVSAGINIQDANKVLIMVHGRGGSAEDILSLATHLKVKDFALLAPQATNNTWYPDSFVGHLHKNEPLAFICIITLKRNNR